MNYFSLIKMRLKVYFLEIDYLNLFFIIKIPFANKVMSFKIICINHFFFK